MKFDVNNQDIVKNRQCAVVTLVVRGANPNGDPDRDGAPRLLPDGCGLITDVSFKQKLRTIFADHKSPVFTSMMEMYEVANHERCYVYESLNRGYNGLDPKAALAKAWEQLSGDPDGAMDRYMDWRWFGTTSLEKTGSKDNGKKKRPKAEGAEVEGEVEEESQEDEAKVRFKRTGVITISPLITVGPILDAGATITKMAAIREDLIDKGAGDMAPGGKKFVPFAVYYGTIAVNPNVASHTGTTIGDIELFKAALKYAYSANESSNRPAGSVYFKNIWWASHKNAIGSFDERKFFEEMRPRKKTSDFPTSIEDFTFPEPTIEGVVDLA